MTSTDFPTERARPDRRTRTVSRTPLLVLLVVAVLGTGTWVLVRDAGLPEGCEAVVLPNFREVEVCEPSQRNDGPGDLVFELVGEPDVEAGLGDLRGRYVVLNFWGAWCGPCRVEQPSLNTASEVLADRDVAFLGVAIQDTQVNQQAFRDEFDVPYPSLFDPSNRLAAAFGPDAPRAPPSTFVLDREGRRAVAILGTLSTGDVVAAVEAVMAADASA